MELLVCIRPQPYFVFFGRFGLCQIVSHFRPRCSSLCLCMQICVLPRLPMVFIRQLGHGATGGKHAAAVFRVFRSIRSLSNCIAFQTALLISLSLYADLCSAPASNGIYTSTRTWRY